MNKAEQRALEKYPLLADNDKEALEALKYICECASEYNEVQESKQAYFIEGYHQAEKDLELTWEDISRIISIDQQVCGAMGISDYIHNHQQAMEEVLKRLKDFKERKEK